MIRLRPMLENEFLVYREYALNDYTRDGKAGAWPSAEAARQEFERLLPKGLATEKQLLLAIESTSTTSCVGFLWLTVFERTTGPEAFILDLVILPEFRRRGFAQHAMQELEQYVLRLGLGQIFLNVFNYNQSARSLYDKMGFVPTNIRMTKRLT